MIDESSFSVAAGDFLGFPGNGVAHTLRSVGEEPLVFLAARHMLIQDVCDYPRKNKRLYMNGAEEALVNLNEVVRLHGDA